MEIEGKTVLVTGSTGFLGRHLINRLIRFKRIRVRGLIIPSLYGTKQFDGLPVEKVFGDITCIEDMREAMRGCDVVVHCAVADPAVTVRGSMNVIKAAVERRVKKFIHISSTAVFGYSPQVEEVKDGRLQGVYSRNSYTDYSHAKITSEKIAFFYHDSNKLPLVILRPSNIYGPRSRVWTIQAIEMLKDGCPVLIDGGLSPSNTVYVDDVVNAIELAIEADDAVGQALTINDRQITTWKDFFSKYAKMLSPPPALSNITSKELRMERTRRRLELLKKIVSKPSQSMYCLPHLAVQCSLLHRIVPLIRRPQIKNKVSILSSDQLRKKSFEAFKDVDDNILRTMRKIPDVWLEKTFTTPFNFPIKGATEILGFESKVSLNEGMKKTEEWLGELNRAVFTQPFDHILMPKSIVSS